MATKQLVTATQGALRDPNFWRQKLEQLGYDVIVPKPMELYFIVTGFCDKTDLIMSGLSLGEEYLRAIMTVNKITNEIFATLEGGVVEAFYTPQQLANIPDDVVEYVVNHPQYKAVALADVPDFPLYFFCKLKTLKEEERQAFVNEYYDCNDKEGEDYRTTTSNILAHFKLVCLQLARLDTAEYLLKNPWAAEHPLLDPCTFNANVSEAGSFEKLYDAYDEDPKTYRETLFYVMCAGSSQLALLSNQYFLSYLYDHFDRVLNHPWFLRLVKKNDWQLLNANILAAAKYNGKSVELTAKLS